MKIIDSHEYIEMYRGDKDLRIGKILAEKFDCKYVVLAPDTASPADSRIFKTKKFPMRIVGKLPGNFRIKRLFSKTIFFSKKNISLGGFFQITPGFIFQILKEKPDVIFESAYTTLTPRMYMSFVAGRILGIPIVYVDAGDIPPKGAFKRFLSLIEGFVMRRAGGIITYNERGKKRFAREYKIKPKKISVIEKPVDTKEFSSKISGSRFREKYGLKKKFVVAYFGRLCNNKGCEHLLYAADKLKNMKDVVFAFVGGNIISKDAKFIRDLNRKLGLKNTVFTGMVPHSKINEAYAAADVVVYPDVTNLPGFSTVLSETMAAGKPIIIGIKGYEDAMPLKHMETGIIIKAKSTEDIVSNVLLLKKNAELRKKLSRNVRKFAEEKMDWEMVARRYHGLFKEVLKRK